MFMSKSRARRMVTAILAGISAVSMAHGTGGAQRRVTVRDGIQMTTLANPWYVSGAPACDSPGSVAPVVSFSPDGTKFVLVLRQGDISLGENHYMMLLWRTGKLGREAPRIVLKISSSSALPGIDSASIIWAQDGRSLTFLGEHASGHHELFRVNVDTGNLQALTEHPSDVMSYSRGANGAVIAYEATPPHRRLWDAGTARHGLVVTTETVPDIISGQKSLFPVPMTERELFVKDFEGTHLVQPLRGNAFLGDSLGRDGYNMAISPDGRYLVVLENVFRSEIPTRWRAYNDWLVQYFFKLNSIWNATRVSLFERYILIDLHTRQSRLLLDTPVLIPRAAIWAPDSRSVILSQVLPGGRLGNGGHTAALRRTVEVDIDTDTVRDVGRRCFLAIKWTQEGLTCEASPDYVGAALKRNGSHSASVRSEGVKVSDCPVPEILRFAKSDGAWRRMDRSVPSRVRVEISLKGNLNTPPKIYYRFPGESKSRLLVDLNPQFKSLQFGRVRQITWRGPEGHRVVGGLYYPPDYRAGRRYALVIQTHGFNPGRFEFFGPYSTALAAMPLAARDMFVLQMDDMDLSQSFRRRWQLDEVKNAVGLYKSAIEYLSERGLIDPNKVGIIGFSHTCLYVKWALVHNPGMFAAASVTEGGDGGYVAFLLDLPNSVDDESLYGGEPFGRNLKTWIRLAPSFNLDRVRAPLLITVLHHGSALSDWEWFEGLRYLAKPVEMTVLDGRTRDDHLLQEPWDRQISANGNVDWFDFWLNGHEDPNPTKAAQYARWRDLRRREQLESRDPAVRNSTD
ncbi:MAG TPA: hypothetical protein VGR92_18135 [Steroidobacteraceae bacterium]|nr:hypothetical protein [Steroidobacteraceae bacterium]